ncbi:hypothetical protein JCM10207_002461 [Rhodosporidiobolus poonsookiae]
MDLLTQPLHRPRSPAHPFEPPTPSTSTSSASTQQSPQKAAFDPYAPSPSGSGTDTDSLASSTDSQPGDDTASRFAALRTAPPPSHAAGEGEPHVAYPSTSGAAGEGNWKAFGRVRAHVVLWPRGEEGEREGMAERGVRRMRERLEQGEGEEWVVEGRVWVVQDSSLLFLLDPSFPPLRIPRDSLSLSTLTPTPSRLGRRLSLGGLGGGGTGSRGASTSPARRRGSLGGEGDDKDKDKDKNKDREDEGVAGFFKKLVSAVKPSSSSPASSSPSDPALALGLSRTRSLELGRRRGSAHRLATASTSAAAEGEGHVGEGGEGEGRGKEKQREREGEGEREAAVTFVKDERAAREEKDAEKVFPEFRGHPLTALSLPSLSALRSVRLYPTHRASAPLSSKDEPLCAVYTTLDSGEDDGIGGGGLGAFGDAEMRPPVVEVDVAAAPSEGEGGAERQANLGREATVAFVFKELLLAQEATSLHSRLAPHAEFHRAHPHASSILASPASPSLAPGSPDATAGTSRWAGAGSALFRTLSGKSDKERAEKEKDKAGEGERPLPPPVKERRRSSFLGFVGLAGGEGRGEGAEPTN